MSEKNHIPVPKSTPAYFCANCGAVALSADNVVRLWGLERKRTGAEQRELNRHHFVITKLITTAGSVRIADKYPLILSFFANQRNWNHRNSYFTYTS